MHTRKTSSRIHSTQSAFKQTRDPHSASKDECVKEKKLALIDRDPPTPSIMAGPNGTTENMGASRRQRYVEAGNGISPVKQSQPKQEKESVEMKSRQDEVAGLKDYVGGRSNNQQEHKVLTCVAAIGRLPGKGCVRLGIQSAELGYWRNSCGQAGQAK